MRNRMNQSKYFIVIQNGLTSIHVNLDVHTLLKNPSTYDYCYEANSRIVYERPKRRGIIALLIARDSKCNIIVGHVEPDIEVYKCLLGQTFTSKEELFEKINSL